MNPEETEPIENLHKAAQAQEFLEPCSDETNSSSGDAKDQTAGSASKAESKASGKEAPKITEFHAKEAGSLQSTIFQDTTIEYNSFAAFTRWRKQQEKAIAQDLKKILAIAIPSLLVFYFLGFSFITYYERYNVQKLSAKTYQRNLSKYSALTKYEQTLEQILAPIESEFLPESSLASFEIDAQGQIGPNGISISEATGYGGKRTIDNKSMEESIRKLEPFPPPPAESLKKGFLPVQLRHSTVSPGILVAFGQDLPFIGSLTGAKRYSQPRSDDDESAADIIHSACLLSGLGLILVFSVMATGTYVSRQATHLSVGEKGWRFLYLKRSRNKLGNYVEWEDMSKIYLAQPRGSTSPFDQLLCFKTKDGKIHRIKMGSIESLDDKQELLTQIKKWGAKVKRSPEVMEALQAPANHSYTELWMQALSAAPKRERLKPLLSGTSLKGGKYSVLSQIGTGGQGSAYLAKTRDGTKVVLKECILPVYVDINVRRAALESFEHEARLLKELEHPQIVQLLDFFVEDHRSYLVLEHIDGLSLRQIIKNEGKLAEQRVAELALQMCEILNYLHRLKTPVIHRDFTPDNLILRSDGKLKLIDFNVARELVAATTSGTVVGKHAYLPPEQFRGMPECASDIYAMGASLFFLLCAEDPKPLTCSNPGEFDNTVSQAMSAIVSRATELETARRYHNAFEIREDLNQIIGEKPPKQTSEILD